MPTKGPADGNPKVLHTPQFAELHPVNAAEEARIVAVKTLRQAIGDPDQLPYLGERAPDLNAIAIAATFALLSVSYELAAQRIRSEDVFGSMMAHSPSGGSKE